MVIIDLRVSSNRHAARAQMRCVPNLFWPWIHFSRSVPHPDSPALYVFFYLVQRGADLGLNFLWILVAERNFFYHAGCCLETDCSAE